MSLADSLQANFYSAFRCIGDACEDTCCHGWGISVDKATYGRYQQVTDVVLQPKLQQLVTIKNTNSDSAYAAIQLDGDRCPFLDKGLCGIQKRLGEDYLCHTCATYPRIQNSVEGRIESSLELSCPEAARLTLRDERPLDFGQPLSGVRGLVLSLLQNRNYAISKRLVLVGHVCDKWAELQSELDRQQFLQGFALAVKCGLYDAHLHSLTVDPAKQLMLALDLMVARVQLDYTLPHYLELYRDFVDGLGLKAGASAEIFGARYQAAYEAYYAPFMAKHQHMLEHYLVSYAFKTMFPFGLPPVNKLLNLPNPQGTPVAQYMLMASYFAISKAVMIGLAAKHKSEFSANHVVRSIHSISRTLEHCASYPKHLLEILASKGIRNSCGMAILTQN